MRYVFGDYLLDVARRELRCQGHPVPLRPKVFDLLVYLICQRDRVVTKQELLTTLWLHLYVSPATLSACIKLARQAVGDSGTMQHRIQTLHGRGYRFVAPVAEQAQEPTGDPTSLVLVLPLQKRVDTADGGLAMAVGGEESPLQRDVPVSPGEWKLVTVLCSAVVAPPPGTPLEVETYSHQVCVLYALARKVVQRYGGTLQSFTGDHILALFGVPLAQEAHAQRAVLAALALQRHVREAESAASTPPDPRFEVRLGLHTGHVAVGLFEEMPEGAGTVVGDTVPRACALQAQAAPGTILCSGATARLVHEVVQMAAVDPEPRAGDASLDAVYTVLERRTPGRLLSLQGSREWTPFIGRARELAALHALVAHVEEGRGQVVGMLGEPGMGKTRLCAEFLRAQLAQPWCILDTRAVSYDQAVPYGPITALLKDYFQVGEHDAALVIRAQITTRLQALDTTLASLELPLLALLNVPVEDPQWQALDPSQCRWQMFQALKHLVLCVSQAQPLLMVIENGHWLDTETQACLDILVESLPAARVLLIITYRPDYQHGWGNKTYYNQIRLDPLPRQQALALLDALLGNVVALRPLKQQMIALAQGNPFFLEESVQTLIETGAVEGKRGAYCLRHPLPILCVPATVQAVLADRLDRLPPEEKRLVQIAAVIGMEVPFAVLQALTERSEAALSQSLAHLQAVEFLYETRLVPARAYTFKHALTHKVAYESLLQRQRRSLHRRIVAVLEALDPTPRVVQVERLAQHALGGAVWDKAVTYYRQAGEKAMARSAHREAAGYFEQALSALQHLPETHDTRAQAIDLRLALRSALVPLGACERGLDSLREAELLAAALDDQHRLGLIAALIAGTLHMLGDPDHALEAGHRASALTTGLGDDALQALVQISLGEISHAQGAYARAIAFLKRNIPAHNAEPPGTGDGRLQRVLSMRACTWLVWCLAEVGAFTDGIALGDGMIHTAETADDPFSLTMAYGGAGMLYLRKGDVQKAGRLLERGLEIGHAADIAIWNAWNAAALGAVYALAGRLPEALPLLEQAVQHASSLHLRVYHALQLAFLSEAYLLAGCIDAARPIAMQALECSQTYKERGSEAWVLRLLGTLAARHAPLQLEPAQGYYRQALARADELGMRPLQAHCHYGLGSLYGTLGWHTQAQAALQTAIHLYRTLAMPFWLPQAEAALAQVQMGDKVTAG